MQFKDVQFLSAKEKEKVLRQWIRFLDSDFDEQAFGEALYSHLIQHCSFIAHYDRQGFWNTYFADEADTPNFLQQFDKDSEYISFEYRSKWTGYVASEPYDDINQAMITEFEKRKISIYSKLRGQDKENKLATIKRLQKEVEELGTTTHQQTLI